MKSNIDKVYSKLPNKKHNFRKHKVDLSLLDDLNNRKDSWTSKHDNITELFEQIRGIKSEFNSIFNDVSSEYNSLSDEYNDLINKASELGADDLADKAFSNRLDMTNYYGSEWDNDILRFLQD